MLTSFARHGRIDLTVQAAGDLEVDTHHTIEDIGIVLGTALAEAVGDGRGITRFADAAVPMDEALARVALDVGGRGYLVFEGGFSPVARGGSRAISSSTSSSASARKPGSPPISRSRAGTITISVKRRLRRLPGRSGQP